MKRNLGELAIGPFPAKTTTRDKSTEQHTKEVTRLPPTTSRPPSRPPLPSRPPPDDPDGDTGQIDGDDGDEIAALAPSTPASLEACRDPSLRVCHYSIADSSESTSSSTDQLVGEHESVTHEFHPLDPIHQRTGRNRRHSLPMSWGTGMRVRGGNRLRSAAPPPTSVSGARPAPCAPTTHPSVALERLDFPVVGCSAH